jgi:hypothetical protein
MNFDGSLSTSNEMRSIKKKKRGSREIRPQTTGVSSLGVIGFRADQRLENDSVILASGEYIILAGALPSYQKGNLSNSKVEMAK